VKYWPANTLTSCSRATETAHVVLIDRYGCGISACVNSIISSLEGRGKPFTEPRDERDTVIQSFCIIAEMSLLLLTHCRNVTPVVEPVLSGLRSEKLRPSKHTNRLDGLFNGNAC